MPETIHGESFIYFDGESGEEMLILPREAVLDCSHSEPCDEDVAYWVNKVEWLGSPEQIRGSLERTGAWEDEELGDDHSNRERILWIAANDIRENPSDYEMEG